LLCLPLLLSWVVTRVLPSAFIVAVYSWTWMGVAVYLLLALAASRPPCCTRTRTRRCRRTASWSA
ncbi:metallophosphoesterase, partial [Corallococcus sicarius]